MPDYKDVLVAAIKEDLNNLTEDGYAEELSYKLLEDGTLAVQTYTEDGKVDKTYIVNMSIGRELSKAEWDAPIPVEKGDD